MTLAVLWCCRSGYEAEEPADAALDAGSGRDSGGGPDDGGGADVVDAGATDATLDADGAPLLDAGDAAAGDAGDGGGALDGAADAGDAGMASCLGDADCQDDVFCNGRERCAPGEPGADARGCLPPLDGRCLAGQTCDEATARCVSDCAVAPDADGDGHAALGCGGGDCDDARAEAFPGAPEICNGLDESCDGLVDNAAGLCRDPGTMGACVAGRCVVTGCSSPLEDCNGVADDGCETDLRSTAGHCGACGLSCGPGGTCAMRSCDGVSGLAAGTLHSCLLREAGGAACWGANSRGELGTGTPGGTALVPAAVVELSDALQLCAGDAFTCALRRDGSVACWGADDTGQLGDGMAAAGLHRARPAPVVGLAGGVEVACGGEHACARLGDGTVRCWGRNLEGQLGDGTTVPSSRPVVVAGLTRATALAAGERFTCALREDRHVRCWGVDDEGELGDGAGALGVISTSPVDVRRLTDAVEVAAGRRHGCARRASGVVSCWGDNELGQLGNGDGGSGVFEPVPVDVAGLTGASALALGHRHSCAVVAGGSVACWGAAAEGALGDGSTPPPDGIARTPVGVRDLVGVRQLRAGRAHVCALIDGPRVRCWGRGAEGQLGDGSGGERITPVAVVGF